MTKSSADQFPKSMIYSEPTRTLPCAQWTIKPKYHSSQNTLTSFQLFVYNHDHDVVQIPYGSFDDQVVFWRKALQEQCWNDRVTLSSNSKWNALEWFRFSLCTSLLGSRMIPTSTLSSWPPTRARNALAKSPISSSGLSLSSTVNRIFWYRK